MAREQRMWTFAAVPAGGVDSCCGARRGGVNVCRGGVGGGGVSGGFRGGVFDGVVEDVEDGGAEVFGEAEGAEADGAGDGLELDGFGG